MGNYEKYPKIKVQGWENTAICGYDGIVRFLKEKISERGNKSLIIALDTYPGVNDEEVLSRKFSFVTERVCQIIKEVISLNGELLISTR